MYGLCYRKSTQTKSCTFIDKLGDKDMRILDFFQCLTLVTLHHIFYLLYTKIYRYYSSQLGYYLFCSWYAQHIAQLTHCISSQKYRFYHRGSPNAYRLKHKEKYSTAMYVFSVNSAVISVFLLFGLHNKLVTNIVLVGNEISF